jgi:hypothetical protein
METLSELRFQMSRTHERCSVRRSLAALERERESGLGAERLADPFESGESKKARPSDQRVEDL